MATGSGADRIAEEAQSICQTHGARVVDVLPLDDGYAVEIYVPKTAGMNDAQWQSAVGKVRDRLQAIAGVKRVLLSISDSGSG